MSKTEVADEFLAIYFEYPPDHLFLSQKPCIEKILSKIKMADCKSCDIKLVTKSVPSDFESGESVNGLNREFFGAVLYLSITTCSDILYSMNFFSQIPELPTVTAWPGLKRVLYALKRTLELKLLFDKSGFDNEMVSL